MRSAKVDAPSFDGQLDLNKYLDWEAGMYHFFEWYDMIKGTKIRYATIKLLAQAKIYWHHIQILIEHHRYKSIEIWVRMKEKL